MSQFHQHHLRREYRHFVIFKDGTHPKPVNQIYNFHERKRKLRLSKLDSSSTDLCNLVYVCRKNIPEMIIRNVCVVSLAAKYERN